MALEFKGIRTCSNGKKCMQRMAWHGNAFLLCLQEVEAGQPLTAESLGKLNEEVYRLLEDITGEFGGSLRCMTHNSYCL